MGEARRTGRSAWWRTASRGVLCSSYDLLGIRQAPALAVSAFALPLLVFLQVPFREKVLRLLCGDDPQDGEYHDVQQGEAEQSPRIPVIRRQCNETQEQKTASPKSAKPKREWSLPGIPTSREVSPASGRRRAVRRASGGRSHPTFVPRFARRALAQPPVSRRRGPTIRSAQTLHGLGSVAHAAFGDVAKGVIEELAEVRL